MWKVGSGEGERVERVKKGGMGDEKVVRGLRLMPRATVSALVRWSTRHSTGRQKTILGFVEHDAECHRRWEPANRRTSRMV